LYLHPNTAQISKTATIMFLKCRKTRAAQDDCLALVHLAEVELLLNGAVGCVSGQFKSVCQMHTVHVNIDIYIGIYRT